MPPIKHLARALIASIADCIYILRGYRFPSYFNQRDRIDTLLHGIEPDVSKFLKLRLRKGMTVLDVGANVGLICRICARQVGRTGRVLAFEPDPYTREFLEFNTRRCPNVSVSPIALSNENTTARLHIHPRSGTSNSLLPFDACSHMVDVECRTLDLFLEQYPEVRPHCIKIDVEGAELKVLGGMRETIRRFPNLFLIVEFCPANLANGGYTVSDYFSSLKDLGLSSEIIKRDGCTEPVENMEMLMNKLGNEIYCNLLCSRERLNS